MKNAFAYLAPSDVKPLGKRKRRFDVHYITAKDKHNADLKRSAEALFVRRVRTQI